MKLFVAAVLLLALAACADPNGIRGRGCDPCADPDYPHGSRTEFYGSVSVTVPDNWSLGYTCATRRPRPYVGRPGPCRAPASEPPDQPAIWFGSPLPVGHAERGGVPSDTIAIGGQHVTVAVRDASLRRRTVESARVVQDRDPNLCWEHPQPVGPGLVLQRRWQVREMSVCAYTDEGTLLWSERVRGQVRPEAFRAAFLRAAHRVRTRRTLPRPRIVVQLEGSAPGLTTSQDFGISFGPARVDAADRSAPLTRALLRSLRSPGLTLYVLSAHAHVAG